ncbi:MAG: LssY C-terminal domain-containing protein [Acidobacteriota bacterium]|nr:LssY C-terminal domain-containing protein [Acidobacteriota bacterium]
MVLIAAAPLVLSAAVPPKLEVRLQNHLTSYSSSPGSQFRCVVIRPFEVNGRIMIPKGSVVFGTVSKEQRVGIGLIHERAALELRFYEYETPDGHRLPISATLASIDNAREQVSSTGRIKGVLAANNPGNLLNGLWSRPSFSLMYRALGGLTGASNQVWLKYSMGPAGAAGLFAIRCLILPFPEPEIHLPPGTDMELTVKLPLMQNGPDVSVSSLPATEGLSEWLKDKLDLVSYANGQPAPDLINLILLGSSRNVSLSFAASGWSKADPRSVIASSHMYEAFSLMQNYATAPVSTLYYRGAEPDLVFEKSLNTITQRHHIRLWKAGTFDGNEVWLGAATHDTGVKFRFSSIAFTHKIDRNIDVEREKVSTDLTFAGCGTASSLHMPANVSTNQDERVTTDGQITVLATQPCIAEDDSEHSPKPPGTRLTRLTRRVVLEARNYILRDNTYYWVYRIIRSRSLW